jgi:hypothetical protein
VIAEHARRSLPVRHGQPPPVGLPSLYHEKKSSVQQREATRLLPTEKEESIRALGHTIPSRSRGKT